MFHFFANQRGGKILGLFLVFAISFLVFGVLTSLLVPFFYRGKILPGVVIAGQKVGGMSYAQAQEILSSAAFNYNNYSYDLVANDISWTVLPRDLGISLKPSEQAAYAYNFGREANFFKRGVSHLRFLQGEVDLKAVYQLDEARFRSYVANYISPVLNTPCVEAEIVLGKSSIFYTESNPGRRILDEKLLTKVREFADCLAKKKIVEIPLEIISPRYTTEEASVLTKKVKQILTQPIALVARDRRCELQQEIWQWLKVTKEAGYFRVSFDQDAILDWLKDLAGQINREAVDAKLVIKKGKVVSFCPDEKGCSLNLKSSLVRIEEILEKENDRETELVIDELSPQVRLENIATLGIQELVARGHSNFRGSPPNRINNIKVGAARFNNVLVKPGEIFSFNQHLGPVDVSGGFRPELVIKGDETTPEYGGGLCQVSTTFFRAVLDGGYPVVERENHSYRVIYYEPAGTDATVYLPRPDLKFINDSSTHLLIKTHIKGTELFFDFYGTKPPYRVELDGPYIYNVTGYPDPVYIETSTLAPGVVKKIDTAHRGADAVLYRYLYDQEGNLVRRDTFKSHYVPWPAKYLMGAIKAPEVETREENIAPPPREEEIPVSLKPE